MSGLTLNPNKLNGSALEQSVDKQRQLAHVALRAQSADQVPSDYEPESRTPVPTHLLKKVGELSL